MLPSLSSLLLLSLSIARPVGATEPARAAGDEALADLAEGRAASAVRRIRQRLGRAEGDDTDALRCILGVALRRAGDEAAAVEVLVAVPVTAPCGRRAAFDRAEALAALGRTAEAAALFDQVGSQALASSRDAALARHLEELAEATLADADEDDGPALDLLGLALELELDDDQRLALALRLADLLLDDLRLGEAPPTWRQTAPAGVLLRHLQLGLADDPRPLRLRLARLLPPSQGLALLDTLPDDAEVRLVRAQVALVADIDQGLDLLEAAWQAAPDDLDLRAELAALLQDHGHLGRAASHLQALAAEGEAAEGDAASTSAPDRTAAEARQAEALFRLARLQRDVAEDPAAGARTAADSLDRWLERFPRGQQRLQVEAMRLELRREHARRALDAGHADEAVEAYGRLLRLDPEDDLVAWEAGVAERAAGRPQAARRAWEELIARMPDRNGASRAVASIARMIAYDQGEPAQAELWLRQQADQAHHAVIQAADAELARMRDPDVAIAVDGRQPPGGRPEVTVHARNLSAVTMRLHRIDPEAYLRAGGRPEGLDLLDVAVIAPDREWTVPVPDGPPAAERVFAVPLRAPGPGLYAVTVATDRKEARTVVQVSDTEVIARARGGEVVVGVLQGGRPASGVDVLVAHGGVVERVRSDGRGIARLAVEEGDAVVLAEGARGPALVELGWAAAEAAPELLLETELDRPLYLPRDTVGFRAVARRQDAPVAGAWRVWLQAGDVRLPEVVLTADRRGAVHGDLPLPGARTTWTLMAAVPGEEAPSVLATVPVERELLQGRRLEAEQDEEGGVIRVVEADGRPVEGAAVELRLDAGLDELLLHTDARGRIEVEAPPAGLPWQLEARLAGAERYRPARSSEAEGEEHEPLAVHLPQDRLQASEPAKVELHGPEQVVVVHLSRELPRSEPAPLVADPWLPALETGLRGPLSWSGLSPGGAGVVGTVDDQRMELPIGPEARELDLGRLPPGPWRMRVQGADQQVVEKRFVVVADDATQGPRLGPVAPRLAAGERLAVPVQGAALVTVEARGVLAAALVDDGALALPLPWTDGSVEVVATGVDGQVHARQLALDARLDVQVEVEEVDGRWVIDAVVQDPSGAPARAELSLRVVDRRLVEGVSRARSLGDRLFRTAGLEVSAGAVAHTLAGAATSSAISAALLAESARQAEAERAQAAATGRLGDSALARLFEEEAIIADQHGGLGLSGYGSGGGGSSSSGYGRGSGVYGGGGGRAEPAAGWRPRLLWHVAETDAQGRVRVELERPPPGDWRIEATAVGDRALGRASLDQASDQGVFLVLPSLAAAGPDEHVRPKVVVVNGGDAALAGTLQVGDEQVAVDLPAGQAQAVSAGELRGGQAVDVVLRARDGSAAAPALATGKLALPVATPARADADGRLLRVTVGPGGGAPLLALALEEDEGPAELGVAGAARAGRAALAVRDHLRGDERARVEAQALRMLALVRLGRLRTGSALEQAEVVAFLAEVGRALPAHAPTRGELDLAVAALAELPTTSRDRVAQLWALAVAGRAIDEPSLGRLLRDADQLDADTRSWLARALVLLDRREQAPGLVEGVGPHAVLARRALGLPVDDSALRAWVPPPGDPERAHHVAALASRPGRARGAAVLRIDGVEAGRLDLAAGGELRLRVEPGQVVTLEGAPGAVVQRGEPLAGRDLPASARVPRSNAGRPLDVKPLLPAAARCGAADQPCRLAPGDRLVIDDLRWRPGSRSGPGLRRVADHQAGDVLVATTPGRSLLTGLQQYVDDAWVDLAPLHVEVTTDPADPASLEVPVAVAMAADAAAAGADPLPWLSPWPGFDDLPERARAQAMALRFQQALAQDAAPADLVAAFEALRDADPGASLELAAVARIARAYAALDRPDRALAAWRAGLGAAFVAEAGAVRRMEQPAGRLTSLRAMRALLLRYPSVPVVDQAEFHLPERLAAMAGESLPPKLVEEGITPTDVRLLAASWDREFLALHPDSPLAPQAGFHLSQGLLRLRAWQAAADQADRIADAWPQAEVLDGLRYVEGLARSELGQDRQARQLFEALATGEWPQADGGMGPAGLRPDARYALARLAEARGDIDAAVEGYASVGDSFPEAWRAAELLGRVALSPEPLVVVEAGEPLLLPLRASNVDTVHLRAYRVDLRTVFLRDGGIDAGLEVQVSGVSPAWSGQRRLAAGPFPVDDELSLPMAGAGAWLVQLDADGVEARALVLRSDLRLDAEDGAGGRRVVVRRGDAPAAAVQVRALDDSGAVTALQTDLRGVAMVPPGAAVLAFDGDHLAFTDPLAAQGATGWTDYEAGGEQGLLQNLDKRVQKQRALNEQSYDNAYGQDAPAAVEAQAM